MLSRSVKAWITVSLASLFIYNAWIVKGSYAILLGYLTNVHSDIQYVTRTGWVFWAGHIGLTSRFAALMLSFIAIFMLWIKGMPFQRAKKLVSTALFLEGLYFAGLIPSVPYLRGYPSLEYGYLLQIVFTVPFLWALASKTLLYKKESQKHKLMNLAAITFTAYTVALFVNEFSRWASMISVDTLSFLFEGIRGIGFVNAVIVMPLSVIFGIAAALQIFKGHEVSALKWLSFSLAVIGLNYLIYLIYSYLANSLNFVLLVDVWTIPLLGLGIVLWANYRKLIRSKSS